jgi:hypothetical protein
MDGTARSRFISTYTLITLLDPDAVCIITCTISLRRRKEKVGLMVRLAAGVPHDVHYLL